MRKKVLIIGNGFDLNLGWETGFKSFAASDYWPVKRDSPECPMEEYLAKRVEIDGWYDLECVIREYALKSRRASTWYNSKDQEFFNSLRYSLIQYLKEEEKKEVNKDSLAIEVLRAIISNGYFSSIYTFNYTDLYNIAEKAEIDSHFNFEFVHGCVARNSIIIGVDDQAELRDGYSYLRKGFSEFYTSHHIRYDLQECDEVVFFGHSLGDIDYPYFGDFFLAQSECKSRADSKHITIFTKDNSSRIRILEQLRKMNRGQTEHLQNDNSFSIIMTEVPDSARLNSFFNHLEEGSREARRRKVHGL